MKTRIFKRLIAVTVVSAFGAFLLADSISAQGRWSQRYTRADVSNIIKRLEDSGDRFKNDFDREIRNSNLNSSVRKRFEDNVKDFENATDDLRSHFDRNDSWWESRTRVQTVVSRANPVNAMMNTLPFRQNIENQWSRLRGDVNTLADTYDLAGLGGGGWNGGGGWGGSGGANRPPSWAVGTWYWNSGGARVMTITNDGRVTVNSGGSVQNGWYSNGMLNIDYQQSTISRNGNNIRTYNRVTGETSNYTRNGGGWGGGGGPGGGGAQNPPSWAVGTWYWNGNRDRILTISNNGQVTVNSRGSIQYGSYSNGMLIIEGERSSIVRNGNQIRTFNQASGERSDYRKR